MKQHYSCDHIKEGAAVDMQLDTRYGLVAVCASCSQFRDLELRLTDGGRVIFRQTDPTIELSGFWDNRTRDEIGRMFYGTDWKEGEQG